MRTHIPVSILEGKKKTLEMQGQCIVSGMCTDVLSLNYKGQHIKFLGLIMVVGLSQKN